ncbi:UvrD-helicase domain-containing protein [Buchnera aphidicola (Hormaphis cornu)]|nr:UvrD-helicase domain-containing protein [Buchnera aphidicola (Hormaphis cornu)]
MDLNYNQKYAIEYISGPCFILAGAGSGKTKVIINKIIHLINQCGYLSKHIVAITFTNQAAQEMKLRIWKQLNYKISQNLNISTFHSLGLRIIQSATEHLNIHPNFSLVNEQEKLNILKKITYPILEHNKSALYKLNLLISQWKNKLINPNIAKIHSRGTIDLKFAVYYEEYEKHLKLHSKLDYDDLILKPIFLFKTNKQIKKYWKNKIHYLLVDEYQDTNFSQYELMKLLNNDNFTFVGDDDQSIYSWRGARPQNLFALKSDFPTLKIIKLEHNYRSSKIILKAANLLISHNFHLFKKKLCSYVNQDGPAITVISGNNELDEVNKVISTIIHHKKINRTQFKDYAILYRQNYQSKIFEHTFLKQEIPYVVIKEKSLSSKKEITILLDYLKFVINPENDLYFLKIINKPLRNIGKITLNIIKEKAISCKKSLFSTCLNLNLFKTLKASSLNSLSNFVNGIQKIISLSISQPEIIIEQIQDFISYEQWLNKILCNPKKVKETLYNVGLLSNWIKEILIQSNSYPKLTLSNILSCKNIYLDQYFNEHQNINQKNAIRLMTLHKSKGLEFSFVFIIGLEEGILPHNSYVIKKNLDEERRLLYVGITRAKKELFLTFSKTRKNLGFIYKTKPSRFIYELPQEDLKWTDIRNNVSKEQWIKSQYHVKYLKEYYFYKKSKKIL